MMIKMMRMRLLSMTMMKMMMLILMIMMLVMIDDTSELDDSLYSQKRKWKHEMLAK